jgi:hypothetical protein
MEGNRAKMEEALKDWMRHRIAELEAANRGKSRINLP